VTTGEQDRWGVAVQARGGRGLALFDEAVESLVALAGEPAAAAHAAAAADGTLALARVLAAYLALYGASSAGVARARAILAELGARGGALDERERLHAEAAGSWADGELEAAAGALGRALRRNPRDLLALKVAQDLAFFSGDRQGLHDVAARVLAAWPAGRPGWGYVQGIYAFGLEENGRYREAEERARAALGDNPRDVWAVHALAHVFEMEGAASQGVDFLITSAPDWETSYFATHNWWHRALYHLELGQIEVALSLYDGPIRTGGPGEWLDLDDAAALLWRLSLFGVDVAERAEALADDLEPLVGEPVYLFNDWHAVMAFGLAGRHRRVEGVTAATTERATGTNRRVAERVGFTLLMGFGAFARDRPARALEALRDAGPRAQMVGGSHAQRDVIDLTAIAAAARAGEHDVARAMVAERVAAKPSAAGAARRLLAANGM